MDSVRILKTDISVTNIDEVANTLVQNKKIDVAICNVNTLVRSYKDANLNKLINSFSIKCPDGFPVAKSSKFLYKNHQDRVDGFNVFHKTIEYGINKDLTHYFYGNNKKVVTLMIKNLKITYPKIQIAGFFCPPIKSSKELMEDEYVEDLISKNADIVWVSLGFPKQEEFIYELKNKYQILQILLELVLFLNGLQKQKLKHRSLWLI